MSTGEADFLFEGSQVVVEASSGTIPQVTSLLEPDVRSRDLLPDLVSSIWQFWDTPLLIIAALAVKLGL